MLLLNYLFLKHVVSYNDFHQFTIITNKKQTRQMCKIKQWYGLFNTIPNNLKKKFCLEILLLFVLIFSFNNINWHCLYVLECFKLLLVSLKLRNLRVNPSEWQLCKNCKSTWFFQALLLKKKAVCGLECVAN